MKNALIALAAIATLGAAPALANNNSFTDGNGQSVNLVEGTFFGGAALDFEPTASIGSVAAASGQVFAGEEFVNGRRAEIRYTIDENGVKDIISKSYRSSDR